MESSTCKEIILKIIDNYILDENDKEFLSRKNTLYSYYLNSNKNIENSVIDIINCLKWRRSVLPKYILQYCSKDSCEYVFKIKNDKIPIIYVNLCNANDDIRFAMYNVVNIIENILKNKEAKIYDIIMDVHKYKTSHYTDISAIINFINILKKYYPRGVNKLFIININTLVHNVLDLVIPYFSEYMNGRTFPIKENNELLKYYNPNIINYLNDIKDNFNENPRKKAIKYNLL